MKENSMRSFDYIKTPEQLLKPEYESFVKYYLGIILKAYSEFEGRVEHLKNRSL